jgi:hypothetical protein
MKKAVFIIASISLIISGCFKETFISAGEGLEDWSFSTHSSMASPDYDIVFPQDKVNRFDITIDPADDLIKWIPWDNNEAFDEGKMGGALSFEFTEINDEDWPLIGYLLGQDEYVAQFKAYISEFIGDVFVPATMETRYNHWADIIQTCVESETSDYSFLTSYGDFTAAISELVSHASTRNAAADAFAN